MIDPSRPRGLLRHAAVALVSALVMSVLGLWAWNTLAPLFGGPELDYRHAVAALILVAIAGALLRGGSHRRGADRAGS